MKKFIPISTTAYRMDINVCSLCHIKGKDDEVPMRWYAQPITTIVSNVPMPSFGKGFLVCDYCSKNDEIMQEQLEILYSLHLL